MVSPYDKLRRFADFQKGWAFGEGEPFSERTLVTARRVLSEFQYEAKAIDVFPGRDGTVTVSVYFQDCSIDIVVQREEPETKRVDDDLRKELPNIVETATEKAMAPRIDRPCLCSHPESKHSHTGSCRKCDCTRFEAT